MKLTMFATGLCLAVAGIAYAAGQDIKDAPDGAAIKLFPDGGYQITAVGSGTYDFNGGFRHRCGSDLAEERDS